MSEGKDSSIEQQVAEARRHLEDFEDADGGRLLERLAAASPRHPTLLARVFLRLFTFLLWAGAIVTLVLPMVLSRTAALELANVNAATAKVIPGGLPALLFVVGALTAMGWWMARMSAASFGREAPMLPSELREHQRLLNDVTRLTSQLNVMERIRGGTPVPGKRVGTPTPMPSWATRAPTAATATPVRPKASQSLLGAAEASTEPENPRSATPVAPRRPVLSDDAAVAETPAVGQRRTRGGTPLGATPRAGTPLGTPRPVPRLGAPRGGPPTPLPDDAATPAPGEAFGAVFGTPVPQGRRAPAARGDLSYGAPDQADEDASDMRTPSTTEYFSSSTSEVTFAEEPQKPPTPAWGMIEDDWLRDAIDRAEMVQQALPIQAHIQYSIEENLPFALVVQRATPAMAVRVMVTYIEFLASIPTPPRARIDLVNVRHIGRTFYRNVLSALEPYYPDSAEVQADEPNRVEIVFHEPHPGWTRYPMLPMKKE